MLTTVKLALRIGVSTYDTELNLLIADCLEELEMLGVYHGEATDQITVAVISYCKWKFGDSDTAEKWANIYHDKVEKLLGARGYGLEGNS